MHGYFRPDVTVNTVEQKETSEKLYLHRRALKTVQLGRTSSQWHYTASKLYARVAFYAAGLFFTVERSWTTFWKETHAWFDGAIRNERRTVPETLSHSPGGARSPPGLHPSSSNLWSGGLPSQAHIFIGNVNKCYGGEISLEDPGEWEVCISAGDKRRTVLINATGGKEKKPFQGRYTLNNG